MKLSHTFPFSSHSAAQRPDLGLGVTPGCSGSLPGSAGGEGNRTRGGLCADKLPPRWALAPRSQQPWLTLSAADTVLMFYSAKLRDFKTRPLKTWGSIPATFTNSNRCLSIPTSARAAEPIKNEDLLTSFSGESYPMAVRLLFAPPLCVSPKRPAAI